MNEDFKKNYTKKTKKYGFPQFAQAVENYYSHVQNKFVEIVENF